MLKMSSNEEMVKKQDEIVILINVASNPSGSELVFDYLERNWDSIFQRCVFGFVHFSSSPSVRCLTAVFGNLDKACPT